MSIGRQAAIGVAWNMLLGTGSRVVQLVGTLLLTRLIVPEVYGPVIAANVLVVTAGVLTSFAFGQYMMAKRTPPEITVQAMVVHISLGVFAMAVVFALRGPLGEFFGTPDTGKYVLGFALGHLMERTRYVPERLMLRALRFREVAAINAAGEVVYTAAALSTAGMWGPYAIVFAWLIKHALMLVLFFRAAPREEWMVRPRVRARDVRDILGYGLPIMIGSISDHIATRFDNLVMSKLFGPAVMSRYNMSYSLAEMPVNNIASQIGDVLMPSFSRMEDAQRRSAVVRAAALMSLVVTPLGVGLAAVSATVVESFFNDKWGPQMALMLAILSIMSVFRPMTWSAIAYLQAVQQTRLIMYSSFFRAIVVIALLTGFGLTGNAYLACTGASIGFALHTLVTIVAAGRAADFSVGAYLAGVARPLLPSAAMFVAVFGVQRALALTVLPLPASLAAQVLTGAAVYIAGAFVFVRPSVNELLRLGRETLRRRRG